MHPIFLSPSKLSDYRNCPRCFWLANNMDMKAPRGIFSSLPGGIDRVAKTYFDKYRGALPPEISGKVPGVLFKDMAILSRWRNWRTGLKCTLEGNVTLGGALDDCLIDGECFIPIDNKTKGAQPKDDGAQYYQTQLDCYNLMLVKNNYQIKNCGYLAYWWPKEIAEGGIIKFGVDVYRLECSSARAIEAAQKAAECLRGQIPKHQGCELCEHILCRATGDVIFDKKQNQKEKENHENNKTGQ